MKVITHELMSVYITSDKKRHFTKQQAIKHQTRIHRKRKK